MVLNNHADEAFHPEGPSLFGRLRRRFGGSPAGRRWRRGSALELWQRSLGFAALGFLTLVPLLIVIWAADPANGQGFAQRLGERLGVAVPSRRRVEQLVALPGQPLRTTTAFSLAALAVFGLSFGAAVQTTYERIWGLPPARWWARWRHAVWLAAPIGLLLLSATTTLWRQTPLGSVAAVLSAVLSLWWSQRMLLGGRVHWIALLPGAVATTAGLLGLRVFSRLVFSPLIATNTLAYGPIGTVLVIQSWLVGVCQTVDRHRSGDIPRESQPRRAADGSRVTRTDVLRDATSGQPDRFPLQPYKSTVQIAPVEVC